MIDLRAGRPALTTSALVALDCDRPRLWWNPTLPFPIAARVDVSEHNANCVLYIGVVDAAVLDASAHVPNQGRLL